jgi:hypothetical protein
MNDNVAEQLAQMAAARLVELMNELAPDEPKFIRAIRAMRPGPYGDAPPIIVEDEIAGLMTERPSLVGIMIGRWMYDIADREGETQKAAYAVVEAGQLIARRIWDEKFSTQILSNP